VVKISTKCYQVHYNPSAVGGVCGGGVAVGRRPTSLEADGVISVGLEEETRAKGSALTGTAPQPPRSLSRAVGPHRDFEWRQLSP